MICTWKSKFRGERGRKSWKVVVSGEAVKGRGELVRWNLYTMASAELASVLWYVWSRAYTCQKHVDRQQLPVHLQLLVK